MASMNGGIRVAKSAHFFPDLVKELTEEERLTRFGGGRINMIDFSKALAHAIFLVVE